MAERGLSILERVRRGIGLGHIPVVDFHTHLGASSRYYHVPFHEMEQVIACMDRYGVDHAVTFALSTTTDPGAKNRSVYAAVREAPGRFTPLVTLHALFPQDWQELLEEGEAAGARGIKLLSDYQGVDELQVDWTPAFRHAARRGWVVLHHDWRTPEHLRGWAERFPEIAFVIGHPTLEVIGSGLLDRCPNVYQCTCAAFVRPGFSRMSIRQMVDALPLDRLLFGSDAQDLDLGTAVGPLAYCDIPEAAKERILGGNALALMGKLGWDVRVPAAPSRGAGA